MSDVYSSFERDHFVKKSKKRQQDFKSNKNTTRGYKVYEPKTSDKPQLKNEQFPNDHKSTPQPYNDYHDYDNYEDYNEYDDYDSKNSRYDKHDNYRQRTHNKSGKRAAAPGGKYTVWKKEIVKVNKDSILKSHEAAPVNNDIDGLVRENSNLFVKEKQSPVNKDAFELNVNDVENQLYHKSSGESVASASTNATNDDRKSMETLDIAYDHPDTIKCLNQMIAKGVGSDSKKKDQEQKENRAPNKTKECKDEAQVNETLSDKTELNEDMYAKKNGRIFREEGEGKNEKGCEETDESEGERCSNIDVAVERKLLNNEVGSNSDVFDELGNEAKKEEMETLEDNEKTNWGEADINQALVRGSSNYIPSSPQDLNKLVLNIQNQEVKTSLFFGDDEDHDDNFSEIFSAKPVGKAFFRPSIDTNIKSDTLGELLDGSKSAITDKDLSATLSSTSKTNGCPEPSMTSSFSSHLNYLQQTLEKQGIYNFSQNTPVPQPNTNMQGATKMNNPFEDQAAPPGFDKPKFVFKYCGHNYEAKIWFYTDIKNLIQGPFSAREMDQWYTVNNLPSDLSISKGMGNNSTFKPLSYYVDRAIQKEIQNLSYDNDYLYYPSPIENGSSGPKVEADPSVQEAQDILAAVNQYNLQAAQEMEISHNIRETFIEEPVIESSTPIIANLFAQGAPRQSRRLAVFDTCNDTVGSTEEQAQNSPKQNATTNSELANQILSLIKNDAGASQNVCNQDLSSPTVPCSSESNICVNNSVLNNLSNPAMNVKSEVQSPMNSQATQQDASLEQSNTPDYRTQPLSAAQIQMLQNFSWQAFADNNMKSTQEPSAMNP